MNMTNKAVVQCEDEKAGERCHVHILDMYFMKVPKDALKADIFYLQPLSQSPKTQQSHGLLGSLYEETN